MMRVIVIWVILLFVLGLLIMLSIAVSFAHDDGRYANSELKPWFDSLKSQNGPCCSFADGKKIEDVDWDTKDGHYRVHLDGKWIDVPDKAVVHEPNRFGPAVVWPWDDSGVTQIRCFIPGGGV